MKETEMECRKRECEEKRPPTRPLDDALYLSLSLLLCVSFTFFCVCVYVCV